VAIFNVRLSDANAAQFDSWATPRGGRSAALRRLMAEACADDAPATATPLPDRRPRKLTVRLSADDGRGLEQAAAAFGLSPNAWAAAVLRQRLTGKPTFPRDQAVALIAMAAELRRIGVNVNQIARALNVAVLVGAVLDLEMGTLDALRLEIRAHVHALHEAFEGNLAYWQGEP
jgi:hypothetical protein